jgi:hypothetical protein
MIMKFKKETLLELMDCNPNESVENLTFLKGKMVDTSRWSIHYQMIFINTEDGKFYRSSYSSTESQDESPYEYDGDDIECVEVFPRKVMVTIYEKEPKAEAA